MDDGLFQPNRVRAAAAVHCGGAHCQGKISQLGGRSGRVAAAAGSRRLRREVAGMGGVEDPTRTSPTRSDSDAGPASWSARGPASPGPASAAARGPSPSQTRRRSSPGRPGLGRPGLARSDSDAGRRLGGRSHREARGWWPSTHPPEAPRPSSPPGRGRRL